MSNYDAERRFTDKFDSQIKNILKHVFLRVNISNFKQDTKDATDYLVYIGDNFRIGARVRKFNIYENNDYRNQITIRSKSATGSRDVEFYKQIIQKRATHNFYAFCDIDKKEIIAYSIYNILPMADYCYENFKIISAGDKTYTYNEFLNRPKIISATNADRNNLFNTYKNLELLQKYETQNSYDKSCFIPFNISDMPKDFLISRWDKFHPEVNLNIPIYLQLGNELISQSKRIDMLEYNVADLRFKWAWYQRKSNKAVKKDVYTADMFSQT